MISPDFKIDFYRSHIPAIEQAIRAAKLDTIVCGLGPTAWLLPWLDQSLLSGIRLWGCNDACSIMPMDDLVVMDSPQMGLHPSMRRFDAVVQSRPKRLWLYEPNAPSWKGLIPECMASITKRVMFAKCDPRRVMDLRSVKFKLDANPLHTTAVSPTGTTALAWREGGRRIGVIGVDMQKGLHHTYAFWPVVDHFFRTVAKQAADAGGAIFNLSPITSLRGFREQWTPFTSGSAQTTGSERPAPSESSNTPSASEPPAPSASTGCEPATQSGPSASTATQEPGSSAAPSTKRGRSKGGARRSARSASRSPR